jgi:hypothetical protein
MADAKPRILFLYYSYTKQTQTLVDTMSEVFRERGCEVTPALIELTDPRFAERFREFPMPHVFRELFGMILPVFRHVTADIKVPDVVAEGDYDFVCIGSPTWWLSTNVPIRSFLASDAAAPLLEGRKFAAVVACRRYWRHNLHTVRKLGEKAGGEWVDGIHFSYLGGQIKSLLSLISYLGSGEYRERYMGVKIPPTNLQPEHLEAARTFAGELADTVTGGTGTGDTRA